MHKIYQDYYSMICIASTQTSPQPRDDQTSRKNNSCSQFSGVVAMYILILILLLKVELYKKNRCKILWSVE